MPHQSPRLVYGSDHAEARQRDTGHPRSAESPVLARGFRRGQPECAQPPSLEDYCWAWFPEAVLIPLLVALLLVSSLKVWRHT